MPIGPGGQQQDSHEATRDRPAKQPHQVAPVDLANGSGHQQYAQSHFQNGFDRNDELEGKEQGQQGMLSNAPPNPEKERKKKANSTIT